MLLFFKIKLNFGTSNETPIYRKLNLLLISNIYLVCSSPETQRTEAAVPRVFCRKGVFEKLAKFTAKHMWSSLFFNKGAGLKEDSYIPKYTTLKRNHSQTFKSSSFKKQKLFSVYVIGTTSLDACFLFHVTTGRHYFYTNLSLICDFFSTVVAFFEVTVMKKSAFLIRYPHEQHSRTMLVNKGPK